MKAKNLPKSSPSSTQAVSYAWARDNIKAKYVPREPREGETLLIVRRPQIGPFEFLTFAARDFIFVGGKSAEAVGGESAVVVAAKPGFTRRDEYSGKRWEQLIVVRPATKEDEAAVAEQLAAQREDIRRAMDRMSHS